MRSPLLLLFLPLLALKLEGSPVGELLTTKEDLKKQGVEVKVLDIAPPSRLSKSKYIVISWEPKGHYKLLAETLDRELIGITFDLLRLNDSGEATSLALSWHVPLAEDDKASTAFLYDPSSMTKLNISFGQMDTMILKLSFDDFLEGLPNRKASEITDPFAR